MPILLPGEDVAPPPAWYCPECGRDLDGSCTRPSPMCRIDSEAVVHRLEEAGRTLLAMPGASFLGSEPRWRTGGMEWVRDAAMAYGYNEARARPRSPDARMISRMDQVLPWLSLIPADRRVLRKVVGARMLVSPRTDRHLYTWRRLGRFVGADHRAVQSWHKQGVDMIVAQLRGV